MFKSEAIDMQPLSVTVPACNQDLFFVIVAVNDGKYPTPIAAICADLDEARATVKGVPAKYEPRIEHFVGQVGGEFKNPLEGVVDGATRLTMALQVERVGVVPAESES